MVCGLEGCRSSFKIDELIERTEEKYGNLMEKIDGSEYYPRSADTKGQLGLVGKYDWTSGYFAGNLWLLYSATNKEKWKKKAEKFTNNLSEIQHWSGSLDVGIIINSSYGSAYDLTRKEEYGQVIVNGAKSICKRYNGKTESLKSWTYKQSVDGDKEWYFPVNIKSMMDLELLFRASEISGDSIYKKIAIRHALSVIRNHYRTDGSCFQIVDYEIDSGIVVDKNNYQGNNEYSSWARGQAWGLYGLVMCYKYTGENIFMNQIEKVVSYVIVQNQKHSDSIPYWDYDLKNETEFSDHKNLIKDASAASITACALTELYMLDDTKKSCLQHAKVLLSALMSDAYLVLDKESYFLLKNNVGSFRHDKEVGHYLVYADYYFLRAYLLQNTLEE